MGVKVATSYLIAFYVWPLCLLFTSCASFYSFAEVLNSVITSVFWPSMFDFIIGICNPIVLITPVKKHS